MKLTHICLMSKSLFLTDYSLQLCRSAQNNWHACKLALEGNIIQYWRKIRYPACTTKSVYGIFNSFTWSTL